MSDHWKRDLVFALAITLGTIQFLLAIVASLFLIFKYSHIGFQSGFFSWPSSLKAKLLLQLFMIILVLSEIITLCVVTPIGYIIATVLLGIQVLVWLISMGTEMFEYNRALGHVWYMHPLLWSYSFLFYTGLLACLVLTKDEMLARGSFIMLVLLQTLTAFVLALLSCIFRKDGSRFNYFDVSDRQCVIKLIYDQDEGRNKPGQLRDKLTKYEIGSIKPDEQPRIVSKIASAKPPRTNSVSGETTPALFEILTRSIQKNRPFVCVSVKRNLDEFLKLSQDLNELKPLDIRSNLPNQQDLEIASPQSLKKAQQNLNAFLQEAISLYAHQNYGFQPPVMLKFLDFRDPYILDYSQMFECVKETIRLQRKESVAWRFPESGILVNDCLGALPALLDLEMHYKVAVVFVEDKFSISVNQYEVCTRTLEEVRAFTQWTQIESIAFDQLITTLHQEAIQGSQAAQMIEILLTCMLNDPFYHSEQLSEFLDPHYFNICQLMNKALREGVIKPDDILDQVSFQAKVLSSQTKINFEGNPYTEYLTQVQRVSKGTQQNSTKSKQQSTQLLLRLSVFEFLDTLRYHCASQNITARIPEELRSEYDNLWTPSLNNSEILESFLNEQVFKDPNFIRSVGMRLYINSLQNGQKTPKNQKSISRFVRRKDFNDQFLAQRDQDELEELDLDLERTTSRSMSYVNSLQNC